MGSLFSLFSKKKDKGIEELIQEIEENDEILKDLIAEYQQSRSANKKLVTWLFYLTILLLVGYSIIWWFFLRTKYTDMEQIWLIIGVFSPILLLPLLYYLVVTGINWGYKRYSKKTEEEIVEMRKEQEERIQKISNHPIYKQICNTLLKIGAKKEPDQQKPKQSAPQTKLSKPAPNPSESKPTQPNPSPNVETKESKESKPNESNQSQEKETKSKSIPVSNQPKVDITAPVLTRTSVSPQKPINPNNEKPNSNSYFSGLVDWLVPDTPTKEFTTPEIDFIKEMRTPSNETEN